jgi:23S rRNA pseudouridine1911/1915/1917 synthase
MRRTIEKQPLDYNGGEAADTSIRLTVPTDAMGMRLDQGLARWLPQFSRSRIQEWIEAGHVTLDKRTVSIRHKLKGGEAIAVSPQPANDAASHEPEDIKLSVVHEDEAIIVIDKPAGLVAHPAAGNWGGTLLNALLHHAPQLADVPRAGIVHRLDKDTSGLLVVAKTLEAQTNLVRQMQERSVRREYLALVGGRVEQPGRVDAALGRHPSQRTRMAVLPDTASGAKSAVTHFNPLQYLARAGREATLLECRLETGRTHQIRVHMQHIGHAIVGDQVYGQLPWRAWFGRQALHARSLGLDHPASGRALAWEAPMPADMQALLDSLEAA